MIYLKSEREKEGGRERGQGGERRRGEERDKGRGESHPVASWIRHRPPKVRREEGGSARRGQGRGEREVQLEPSRPRGTEGGRLEEEGEGGYEGGVGERESGRRVQAQPPKAGTVRHECGDTLDPLSHEAGSCSRLCGA